jgi:hypothetical protein
MNLPSSDRRRFIAGVAGGIAGIAVTACAGPLQATTSGPAPASGPGRWDDSWTGRLGRYRTAFDVNDLDAEPGADAVPAVMDAWHEVHGTTDRDLGIVLVLRHRAVPFFFSDALWARYDIAQYIKEKDPVTKLPYKRNPRRELVTRLQERGVIVLGCNKAVNGFIGMVAEQEKTTADVVRPVIMAGLMPGVILQPNGLYALARAQNVGCGFMR